MKFCPKCKTCLVKVYGEPTCPNKECINYGLYVEGVKK
jgi:uncharacterized Zn finger protein (UPF0148 family)